ncbi:MAG: UvrD-helicase domain-containing protein [Bryobacteraceae bacterium]
MTPSVQPQFDDEGARRRIRESLQESLIVEAAAGTGKTSELVRRLVNVLAAGLTTIERVVAVTFTHKAAGELKLRLRHGLDQARAAAGEEAAKRNLEDALARLEEAAIGTIHSFCAQILRERPVEAVVDPAFVEMSESQAARLYDRAFRKWFAKKLGETSPALRRTLTRMAWDPRGDTPPADELKLAGWRLIEWRDYTAEWKPFEFERRTVTDSVVGRVTGLANILRLGRTNDELRTSLRPVEEFATWIARAEADGKRDYDTVEAHLLKVQRDLRRNLKKGKGSFSGEVTREQVLEERDYVLHMLKVFQLQSDADLAPQLRAEMWSLVEEYTRVKREAGALDFVDLLLLARDLLRDNAGVRGFLQRRYSHIFVDEFQDTDPLQAEVLLLLSSGDAAESGWMNVTPAPGKLFVVGDPKQSIYKFRRADVVLYQQLRANLVDRGAGLVHLTKSFRSVRTIQQFVNCAFEPEMTGDGAGGQASYVPLEEVAPDNAGSPAVIALPAPKPYGLYQVSDKEIERCLPDSVVAFVEWLLRASGWQVRDPEDPSRLVAVRERHVAILFRRFTNWGRDMTRDYVRGLEARGIPHLLVGSKSFHRREEVEALRAALAAIEWPDDELSVFATLRGPMFFVADDLLLRYRAAHGRLHPLHRIEALEDDFAALAAALGELAKLHKGRNHRPIAETVNLLLEAARAHAGFAFRPAGRQALANAWRIADLARSFELEGGVSFRGFVEELSEEADKVDAAEAPILEEGAEGVRLMTVHGAKGLEFPVVILADMTANLSAAEPERYIDPHRGLCAMRLVRCAPQELHEHADAEKAREQAEGVRVAYVASTRARDLLVAPAVGDLEVDGWLAPLSKALYPEKKSFRVSRPAPGCPKFGGASVLERPPHMIRDAEASVRPGLHSARAGGHDVVWWDPAALRLGVEPEMGLRQQELLAEEGTGESLRAYRAWRESREAEIKAGSAATCEVVLASETREEPAAFTGEVEVIAMPRAVARPGGRRFGALVHAVLRDAGLQPDEPEVARLAAGHGKLLGAPGVEIEHAREAVLSALAHELLARARAAPVCHRELPVALPVGDAKVVEGVIDLAFREEGGWVIADFKTDAHDPARRAGYRRQLRWYAAAMERLTSTPARGVLVSL